MGFLVCLNFQNSNPNLEVIYKGSHLTTATILNSELTIDSKIPFQKSLKLLIDDRNSKPLEKDQASQIFQMKFESDIEGIQKRGLEKLQYLTFLVDSEVFIICLHPGVYEGMLCIDSFPSRDPPPIIRDDPIFIESKLSNSYWEHETFICFE